MSEPSLPDKVVALDVALAAPRIPHAFGGALALAYYAEPRATIDVDLNVFVAPVEHPRVATALDHLGVEQRSATASEIERDGQTRWWWGRTPLDLFFAYDALHEAMSKAVRKVPFGDRRIPILAPEHLAVCKAIFDRPKDWLDLEQMLVHREGPEPTEVLAWLDRALGPAAAQTTRFRKLVARSV